MDTKLFYKGYEDFVKGMPLGLPIISLSLLLLSPSFDTFVLFIGATVLFISAILNTKMPIDSLKDTTISLHGLLLGYFAGFMAFKYINDNALVSALSSTLFAILFAIIISETSISETSKIPLTRLMIGVLIGFLCGWIITFVSKTMDETDDEKTN